MPATKAPRRRPRERKLPWQQLTILSICRFAEPIASTSLFPYLPEMIRSFGIPEKQVGKWAGICSAVFSLCQAVLGVTWGRFADRYGRKPAILLSLTCTMITTLLWGFSTSLVMAIVVRGIAGAGSGNVGIIRTTVAEMVPFRELQPKAFSIMPMVWSIGSIFGPAFGGALANPYNVEPGETFSHPNLLQRFPYALPNLIACAFYIVGIVTGVLFLEETLESVHRRDYGLVLGDKLKRLLGAYRRKAGSCLRRRRPSSHDYSDSEREPLLKSAEADGSATAQRDETRLPPPEWREVLNRQAVLNLLVYTLLALHNFGFDQLIPVFAQYPPLGSEVEVDPTADTTFSFRNPLKFAGGFGLDHWEIGMLNMAYGVCGMIIQFFIFPPVARRFGVLNCLRVCLCAFPLVYLAMPFTALLPTKVSRVSGCFALMLVKCFLAIFSFPSSTILLTNSASSLRVLGTLNGIATSTSALGRAAGPAIGGSMFTVGVQKGYVLAPWWTLGALAVLAAFPVFLLVEGEGFGGDDGEVSDEEDDDDDDEENPQEEEEMLIAATEANDAVMPAPIAEETVEHDRLVEQNEEGYGVFRSITRESVVSSTLSLGSDEYSTSMNSRDASLADSYYGSLGTPTQAGALEARRHPSRTDINSQGDTPGSSHRVSRRRVVRKISVPIGMGTKGISRKYSSNLGQSLGSEGM